MKRKKLIQEELPTLKIGWLNGSFITLEGEEIMKRFIEKGVNKRLNIELVCERLTLRRAKQEELELLDKYHLRGH